MIPAYGPLSSGRIVPVMCFVPGKGPLFFHKNWHGVGHNAVAGFNGTGYLVFHTYDAADNGKPKLRIEKIFWLNDWAVVGWNSR